MEARWSMSLAWAAAALCGVSSQTDAASFAVADYGAVADSEQDAGPAVRAALKAAVAAGPGSEVVFDRGAYRIAPTEGDSYCIRLQEADGITVRGTGPETEILLTRPDSGAFWVGQSSGVAIRDLTIDYDPVPFCQGAIVAVDVEGGSFDLQVADGYPTPDGSNFLNAHDPYGKWGMVIDPALRRIKSGQPDHCMTPQWEHVEGRVYRFFTREEHYRLGLARMSVGDSYVHLARGHANAIMGHFCEDLLLEGIRIHASPALAIGLVANSGNVTVRRVQIVFRDGTDRLLTTDADGVHCQQNRARLVIEDCLFEGMADDGINIYAPPNVVHEVRSPTEWLVSSQCHVLPGDRLQVFDPQGGVLRGEVTALQVQPHEGKLLLTLAEPLEGVTAGADSRTADTLYNMSACGAGFVIRRNVIRSNRRFGCMLRAGDGLVEGNLFQDNTGAGIAVLNEPDWPEGPVPWSTTIRGNRFVRGGTCLGYADAPNSGQLFMRAVRLGFALAPGRPIRGMVVENNEFVDALGASVYIGATSGLMMRGNRIRATAETPRVRGSAAIIIADSEGAKLLRTRLADPRPTTTAAVAILADTEPGEDGVRVEDLVADLASDTLIVDER